MLLEVPHTMESASKELYRTQFTNKANDLFKDLKEKEKLSVQTDATPLLPRSSAGGLSLIDWDGRCTSGDQPTVSVHAMARPKGLSLKEMLGEYYLNSQVCVWLPARTYTYAWSLQ